MRFITLDESSKVISVRNGFSALGREIESEVGEVGQIMQEDGSFITPEPSEPQVPEPTMRELKENQVAIMNGLIDLYMSNLGG